MISRWYRGAYAILALLQLCFATELTYKLASGEKQCFFAQVESQGSKLAFYFAVSPSLLLENPRTSVLRRHQADPEV